jgi:hypothetical protein
MSGHLAGVLLGLLAGAVMPDQAAGGSPVNTMVPSHMAETLKSAPKQLQREHRG